MRCSIVGTTISTSAWCSAMPCSVFSGLNRRFITTVQPSAKDSTNCDSPVPWKIGAAM